MFRFFCFLLLVRKGQRKQRIRFNSVERGEVEEERRKEIEPMMMRWCKTAVTPHLQHFAGVYLRMVAVAG